MNTLLFSLEAFSAGRLANFAEIVWLAGDGNYTHIHLRNGYCIVASENISLMEQALVNGTDFMRIHKRYMVNSNYITAFDAKHGTVSLQNGQVLLVARRRKRELKAWFKQRKT